MTKKEIAKQYIEFLAKGDIEKVIGLFSENGTVISPIYGESRADQFYKTLNDDTISSELRVKGIFEDPDINQLALYFEYKWTVASGKMVEFDVVDIIEFDHLNKISVLKIIYDTVVSRELIAELKNS